MWLGFSCGFLGADDTFHKRGASLGIHGVHCGHPRSPAWYLLVESAPGMRMEIGVAPRVEVGCVRDPPSVESVMRRGSWRGSAISGEAL